MLIALFPAILALVGILMWALASNGLVKEAGKWLFIIGMWFVTAGLSGHTVKIL